MLDTIGTLDADVCHLVKCHEHFIYGGHPCLVFEMLHMSLYDLMEGRAWQPLPLHQVKPIVKQILEALAGLKSIGLIHGDLKPDNIMLVDGSGDQPRVKLIDFGQATPVSAVKAGDIFASLFYRYVCSVEFCSTTVNE